MLSCVVYTHNSVLQRGVLSCIINPLCVEMFSGGLNGCHLTNLLPYSELVKSASDKKRLLAHAQYSRWLFACSHVNLHGDFQRQCIPPLDKILFMSETPILFAVFSFRWNVQALCQFFLSPGDFFTSKHIAVAGQLSHDDPECIRRVFTGQGMDLCFTLALKTLCLFIPLLQFVSHFTLYTTIIYSFEARQPI